MSEMTNVLDPEEGAAWNPDDITQFRFEQFTSLGFNAELSAFLAESKIDLHRVGDLIVKGATSLQAVRIEAGRDWHDEDPQFDHREFDRLMEAASIPDTAEALDPDRAKFFDFVQ